MTLAPPPAQTLERWAYDYVTSEVLAHKLSPPPLPRAELEASWESAPPSRRALRPVRTGALVPVAKKPKTPTGAQLRDPRKRAALLHVFFHHELQAAELFAWAMLTYVEAPRALRLGWLKLLLDEARHMRLYAAQIERLGAALGDFPVRDWFWERVPACPSAASFLALVGVGLEGGNLDHGARFTQMLEDVGDHEAAEVERRVAREEIAHVRFAVHWLDKLGAPLETLEQLSALLPPPLSPLVLRGLPLAHEARLEAGLSRRLVEELAAFAPR